MSVKFFLSLFFLLAFYGACGQGVATHDIQTSVRTVPIDTVAKKARTFTRFEKEIIHFEESDKASKPKEGGILFVGSSSVRLWKTVEQDMAPMPILNRGFGGATIGEVNYYYKRIVAKYKPKIMVFYAGENDLAHPQITVDSVIKDFNAFRDSMRVYLPYCKMYFISVKPSPARWAYQQKFTEANNRFKAICDADPRWTYVDIVPQMLTMELRPRKDIYRSDSLHMNSIGYGDWTKILSPYLKEAWKTSEQNKAR